MRTPTPLPREQFPVTERFNYLNHAGVSPIPIATCQAIEAAARDFALEGGCAVERWVFCGAVPIFSFSRRP